MFPADSERGIFSWGNRIDGLPGGGRSSAINAISLGLGLYTMAWVRAGAEEYPIPPSPRLAVGHDYCGTGKRSHCGKCGSWDVAFRASRSTARTYAVCRCHCARPISNASWRGGRTASLSRRSNGARSAPICSAPPATWGWRAWCRSALTGPIRLAGRGIGSR